jgi:orotidine-5'-phosphate decarboxylase
VSGSSSGSGSRPGVSGNPLIVALDTPDLDALGHLAALLGPEVGHLKVGLEAFAAHGPAAVRAVADHGRVFCDLKLHDIPNTVAGAAAAAAQHGIALLTVHAGGGPAMVRAAVEAAPEVTILAVTVLTSLDDEALRAVGQPPAAEQVPRLAAMAAEAGAGGIVCAPTDVAAVRAAVGPDVALVTPGVRPAGAARDDQARVATPAEALRAGADHLVVGRPITGADDPVAAARAILEDL